MYVFLVVEKAVLVAELLEELELRVEFTWRGC